MQIQKNGHFHYFIKFFLKKRKTMICVLSKDLDKMESKILREYG